MSVVLEATLLPYLSKEFFDIIFEELNHERNI
jgi:hypothetical protein